MFLLHGSFSLSCQINTPRREARGAFFALRVALRSSPKRTSFRHHDWKRLGIGFICTQVPYH
ncbi:hypothetical protein DF3PA_50144 [Candidatus Defluviicoccus seviourii]|uniref:Uncharacterized protein n=1 Tax=Candidatus Defluviicoccus seviourii TaxID=2565273 RepID=A0A564WG77_9PROT|nr:hypothetical protein DF3PA_50144 [Candidatus Defluviicoccus seviourii]